jgi:hypothetical protein
MLNSKRGDIGKTITWIVATIIIVGILILFVYISSVMSTTKIFKVGEVNSDLGKESQVLSMKTSLAYKLNNSNKEIIDKILGDNNGK